MDNVGDSFAAAALLAFTGLSAKPCIGQNRRPKGSREVCDGDYLPTFGLG